jgi:hypothetical protein
MVIPITVANTILQLSLFLYVRSFHNYNNFILLFLDGLAYNRENVGLLIFFVLYDPGVDSTSLNLQMFIISYNVCSRQAFYA